MRRIVVLLATVATGLLLASGVALAATPGDGAARGVGAKTTSAKASDAALDGALKALVARHGGPPGVIAVVQRG